MTTIAAQNQGAGVVRPASSSLGEVVGMILDKGLVIDAYVRASLIGIEILTIEARVVIAGIDTYLRFADAINRLSAAGDGAAGTTGAAGVTDVTTITATAAGRQDGGRR